MDRSAASDDRKEPHTRRTEDGRHQIERPKQDLDARLDDALDDTFPASDPIELSSFQD